MSVKRGLIVHYRVSAAADSCKPMLIEVDTNGSNTVSGHQIEFTLLNTLLPTARNNVGYDPNTDPVTNLPAGTSGTWHYMGTCPD